MNQQPPAPPAIVGNITHFAERSTGELIIITATLDNGSQYDILYSQQQDQPITVKNEAVKLLEARNGMQFELMNIGEVEVLATIKKQ